MRSRSSFTKKGCKQDVKENVRVRTHIVKNQEGDFRRPWDSLMIFSLEALLISPPFCCLFVITTMDLLQLLGDEASLKIRNLTWRLGLDCDFKPALCLQIADFTPSGTQVWPQISWSMKIYQVYMSYWASIPKAKMISKEKLFTRTPPRNSEMFSHKNVNAYGIYQLEPHKAVAEVSKIGNL